MKILLWGSLAVECLLGNGHWKVSGRLVGKHKRYLFHGVGHNLGLLIRFRIRTETPKEAAGRGK